MPLKKNRRKGNKPKFYEKARQWFSVKGRIRTEGFRRVAFRNRGEFIEIETSKGKIKVMKRRESAIYAGIEKPLYAFESSEGRIILVTKGRYKIKEAENLAINAYTVAEEAGAFFLEPVATASAHISKEHKVAYMTHFQWLHEEGAGKDLYLAPGWLRGKGFGLFLDSLRHVELARLGVRKWFANIANNPESRKFAELRGFRRITREEATLLAKLAFGDSRLVSPDIIRESYVVKDLMPVRRKKAHRKKTI